MTTTITVPVMGEKRGYGTGTLYAGADGYWYGRWRTRDGRRPHRKLGPVKGPRREGLTKMQAEAKLRDLIIDDPGIDRRQHAEPITLQQAGERLVARLERDDRKRSYIESIESDLNTINPLLGDLLITDLQASDVDRLVSSMLRKGRSPKTIRNKVGTLHAVLERAVRDGLLTRNVVTMAELPRVKRSKRLQFLTLDELDRVLAAAPSPDDDTAATMYFPTDQRYGGAKAVRAWWPVVRLLVQVAAMTGLRLGELRGLRWRDVGERIQVRETFVRGVFDDPKSDLGSRAVPIAETVMTALDEHHKQTVWNQDDDLVFAHPHTGNPLDKRRLGLHFKAALLRADVRVIRFHDLRHTFATTLAASGQVSLRTLQEWLGHEDIRTTQIYAHYMPGEREAELIEDAFARGPIPGPISSNTMQAGEP